MPNPWRTYKLCLEQAGDRPLLVVQDDATPCRDVIPACARIAAARPGELVSLYVGHIPQMYARMMVQATEADERWIGPLRIANWLPCVALLWPPDLARSAATARPIAPADDAVLGRWAHLNHVQPWAVVPSLVDHDDDHPSLVGRRWGTEWRRARIFAGADARASAIWPPNRSGRRSEPLPGSG